MDTTGFFKCYGIGMLVGDPLKVGAVANVFGESGVLIRVVILESYHAELDRVSVGVKLPKGPCLLVFSVSNSKSLAVWV
ncbi:hypothetical protein BM1_02469 [Bipolaris maydis]|nr:hypothetical protein BM1_02469 [Bipolaris maydis]